MLKIYILNIVKINSLLKRYFFYWYLINTLLKDLLSRLEA